MQMGRPHVVALLDRQQVAAGAVDGHAVAGGLDAVEPEAAVGVGQEDGPQVHVFLVRILVFVESAGRGLPGFQACARQRRAVERVQMRPVTCRAFARGVVRRDPGPALQHRLVGAPERPDQGGFGSAGLQHALGVHQQDQRGHAQDVGQQDALVAQRIAGLPHAHHEVQPLVQFFVGQLHVRRERMQMADQGIEDPRGARILRLVDRQDGFQQRLRRGGNGALGAGFPALRGGIGMTHFIQPCSLTV